MGCIGVMGAGMSGDMGKGKQGQLGTRKVGAGIIVNNSINVSNESVKAL